jgi:hypothetical protein
MNDPPTPSPMIHTPNAQPIEMPRAKPTIGARPQTSPAPIATCNEANRAFHNTKWAVRRLAMCKSALAKGRGRPMFAMPRIPSMNSLVNM